MARVRLPRSPAPLHAKPADPRLTDVEFAAWVGAASPGDRLEYHRGFLAADTVPIISKLAEPKRDALKRLAAQALRAAEINLVHLVQVRLGPDHFAYIAIARPKPKRTAVSLSTLLLEEAA